jgi:glycosyltransferase involved in cell wall biosynthesis
LKRKLLYFYTGNSSFVENDIKSLEGIFEIKKFLFRPSSKGATIGVYVNQFFFLLRHIFSARVIVCFFGSHHSLLPSVIGRIFGKPCVIILGGTDCVSFPSINYGNFNKKGLARVSRWSYKYAFMLLPVHKSLIDSEYTYQDKDYRRQGFLAFCPGLKTPYKVISFGFDPEKWNTSSEKIPDSFITVAAGLGSSYRVKLKGVDLILEAAVKFPHANFTIIGFPEKYKLPENIKNVIPYSYVSNEQLKDFYNKHEFYVQVSMSEGFPNAICEAMTCGCIPIGSNVGGIPDIVGDSGFILYKRDSAEFETLLKRALASDKKKLSEMARKRIIDNYPKDLRAMQLVPLLLELSN